MNYIYAPESVAERQHIFTEIREAMSKDNQLEMFQEITGLAARLRRFNNPEMIILLGVGKKDLEAITALRKLIRDASIIIMLSRDEPEMVTAAICLRPRFLGIMNHDMDKILPIARRILLKKRKPVSG